jgi:hypothetical protein
MPGCDSGNGVPSRWEAFRSSSGNPVPLVWQVWRHELLPVREGRPWSAIHVGTNPEVLLTEPIEGIVDATGAQLGGTRHLSAAQFAHEQRDTIALAASQDGQFTAFAWSSMDNIVHAYRLESLLI